MKSLKKKKLINHVVYLIDCSGSMAGRLTMMEKMLAEMIDKEVKTAKLEKQETKISVFTFGDNLIPVFSNFPTTHPLPKVRLNVLGGTALIRATSETVRMIDAMLDLKNDNAVILRVLTDGQETEQRHNGHVLSKQLNALSDDWTVAILVPDKYCEQQAIQFGFPDGNIEIWDVSSEKGFQQMANVVGATTQSFYSMRAMGQKSTKTLFDLKNITKGEVVKKLDEVDPGEYETLLVRKYDDGRAIKDFVEAWTKRPYRVGSAYYQVTKPEKIQAGKVVAVIEKSTGKMFSGLKARSLLGLPNAEVKVAPADFKLFDLFVQSTSTNRKLVADTCLIVFK